MLPALALALAALSLAVMRLIAYRRQMLEMARVLEETPAQSNLRLTLRMSGAPARRLCRAMNARLDASRELRAQTERAERELKTTMACISHDIRTPLAAAMGYLQLMDGAPDREYLSIVKKRLEELGDLLDELFLYTRLKSEPRALDCGETAALPPLWEALAEFCPQLEALGIEPKLCVEQEDMRVWANEEALGRVYRNLIANAIRHGGGGLAIVARDGKIGFSNPLGPGPAPDPEQLFDHFYQGSPARGKGGAGLGLAIVRELTERMGGHVSARVTEDELQIWLTFSLGRNEA